MRLTLVLAAFLSLAVFSPAMAETIILADLIDNNSYIISGDKMFDNFGYTHVGNMPSAAAVTVSDFVDPYGNYGITFQGGFIDLYGESGASDALITYRVTVLDPNKWISDAHIYGNPIAIGDAAMQVAETFLPTEPDSVFLSIHHISPSGEVQRMDSVVFEGLYKSLYVQKDILAFAKSVGSAATISMISQSFSQVPEPSTMITLALGLALFGCFVGRNRR